MSALDQLSTHFGILPVYHLLDGQARPTSPETQRALLRANGIDVSSDAAITGKWEAISRAA